MMRASILLRLSPLLVLAAVLVALAAVLVHDARPAQAQSTTIWSATLTVGGTSLIGCLEPFASQRCSDNLTANTFAFRGRTYQVTRLYIQGGQLFLVLDQRIPDALKAQSWRLDGVEFPGREAHHGSSDAEDFDLLNWGGSSVPSWSAGDTVQVSLELVPPEVTVTASGPLREGGPPVNVTFTLDRPTPSNLHATLGHNDSVRFDADGPRFAKGATRAVMELSVPQDQIDNNCRTLHLQVWFLPYVDGAQVQADVAFTVIDDDGTADTCSGLLGSPYPTQLSLQFVEASRWTEKTRATYLAQLDRPPLNRNVVSVSASSDQITQRDGFSGADGDYYLTRDQFSIWAPHTNPTYTDARGTHDWPIEIWIWDSAPDHAIITLEVTTEHPALSITVPVQVNAMRGLANRQSSDGGGVQGNDGDSGQPTAVTLALDAATVSEDAGDVTLTAALDAPAPEGGIGGFLFAGDDGTATADIDFTMPFSIYIPGGQRSATATISIVDDHVDEADETVALSALFDMGTAILEDKITLTIADDDTAGVTVSAANPLAVTEGGSATYTVVLDSQPTADVKVTPSTSDAGAATVSPASHTFTPSGWNTAKTFTVSGVADTDGDDESVAISHSVTSDDAKYGAVLPATVSVAVSDTTTEQQSPQDKYASLIAKIKQWRDDPCCASNKDHTDRWDKALLAFGESVADASLTPMTATEAQGYADRGWTRWVEVAAALRELESGGQQDPGNSAPTVSTAIADVTIVNESGTHEVSLSGVFNDADSDSLTITVGSSNESVSTVSVTSDYSKLTVTAKSRGTATITATASDGRGGTVSDAFTVKVKAAPAVASAISDISALESFAAREISLSGVFSDADGDSLTLSASSSDNMVVDAALVEEALTIFALEQGTATITVTAQDSDGNTVSDSFDVSVVGPPTPVVNLRCVAETSRVAFLWDAPEWSSGQTYAYDYQLTLPGGKSEGGRIIGSTLLLRTGTYQVGAETSVTVKAVYELPDGSNISSAEATLTCTVA